ncbi:uncharacterized protein LOC113345228 [Papaver somniferum]|uniref:uncharacterized protein LOC113345228 n=1 Tax=Papaver somniferum TaxID=3469 RepID=UPI000E6F7535|nr:uncharacterized protein LOC113345228 [Papaver somniferum]
MDHIMVSRCSKCWYFRSTKLEGTINGERTGLKGTYAAGIIDAEAGECMAILEGLKWAKEMELDNTHLVADAEVVVNSINNSSSSLRWENRKLLRDIKSLLSSFSVVKISCVRRENNQLADSISKKVRKDRLVLEEFSLDILCIETLRS